MSTGILSRLRDGETVDFEGAPIRMQAGKSDGRLLAVGDTYMAERNSGPKLLTVRRVRRDPGTGWVEAEESWSYSFDLHECVGVEFAFDEAAVGSTPEGQKDA